PCARLYPGVEQEAPAAQQRTGATTGAQSPFRLDRGAAVPPGIWVRHVGAHFQVQLEGCARCQPALEARHVAAQLRRRDGEGAQNTTLSWAMAALSKAPARDEPTPHREVA
ncbi:MAG TPA: hypothetical protein VM580_21875, partial [Labilithrix sp.]|nr:hypothetical protein [Labilithrix sp.]